MTRRTGRPRRRRAHASSGQLGAAVLALALGPGAAADPVDDTPGVRSAGPPAPAVSHSIGADRAPVASMPAAPAHVPTPVQGGVATHAEADPSAPITHPAGADRAPASPVPALSAEAPAPGGAAPHAVGADLYAPAVPSGAGLTDDAPEPVGTAAFAPAALLPSTAALGAGFAVTDLPGAGEPIKPIPEASDADPEKVALGRALFHDPRLSKDNTTACVSCHDLGSGGDDGRVVSIGVEGRAGAINAPTVFNAGLNFRQFWDGRAETLEHQIDGPVQAADELGSLWPEIIEKLYAHESYPARFGALFPDGITRANVKNVLATFMRSLVTPNSRFDQWLKGEADALTAREKRGYALFKHYGCVSCHQGANVGGNMFQVFGVLNNYFHRRGNITDADLGRFNVTGNPADRHAFKVPSLRMAALTAPYLHDGSAATLRDAVDAMFEFQLGREAPDDDKDAIVAFIETLAGENRELAP